MTVTAPSGEREHGRLRSAALRSARAHLEDRGLSVGPADLDAFYNQAWRALQRRRAHGEVIESPVDFLARAVLFRTIDEERNALELAAERRTGERRVRLRPEAQDRRDAGEPRRALITAYALDALDPAGARYATAIGHVRNCSRCRERVRALRALAAAPPAGVSGAGPSSIAAAAPAAVVPAPRRIPRWAVAAACAAVLVAGVAVAATGGGPDHAPASGRAVQPRVAASVAPRAIHRTRPTAAAPHRARRATRRARPRRRPRHRAARPVVRPSPSPPSAPVTTPVVTATPAASTPAPAVQVAPTTPAPRPAPTAASGVIHRAAPKPAAPTTDGGQEFSP